MCGPSSSPITDFCDDGIDTSIMDRAFGMSPRTGYRILFLDAYDSFTNNIVAMLKEALLPAYVKVYVLRMDLCTLATDPNPDWTMSELQARFNAFDAVVCGPGPGSPLRDADVGVFPELWSRPRDQAVPVLGICLGFQSLAVHFGGQIRRLRGGGLHGIVRDIEHKQAPAADIFEVVPPFKATLYHSLGVDIWQENIAEEDWAEARWAPLAAAPDLVPLAWTVDTPPRLASVSDVPQTRDSDGEERILMAVRHASLPFWGIQYHPESVCTDSAAHAVIRNWFHQALKWNETTGRRIDRSLRLPDSLAPINHMLHGRSSPEGSPSPRWWQELRSILVNLNGSSAYRCRQIRMPDDADTTEVAESLGLDASDTIILDSSSTVNGDPLARSSIIAADVREASRFEYRVGDDYITLYPGGGEGDGQQVSFAEETCDPWAPWHILSEIWSWRRRRQRSGNDYILRAPAFTGGFMGFISYEMGLSTSSPGLVPTNRGHRRPDVCLAWVTKSIVLDHKAGLAYVQALSESASDDAWVASVVRKLQSLPNWLQRGFGSGGQLARLRTDGSTLKADGEQPKGELTIKSPDPDTYEEDVRRCQVAIRDGESYELCLTAQTTVSRPAETVRSPLSLHNGDGVPPHTTPRQSSELVPHERPCLVDRSWQLFRVLRSRHPAPFGSFLRLGGITLISSSPERFLTHDENGVCVMRPMKGTVRKSEAVPNLAAAKALLHVPKEEAENLMIVDLVRHDIYGVCGPGRVTVLDLLRVEEYATVFQMSSVVQGRLPLTHGISYGDKESAAAENSAASPVGGFVPTAHSPMIASMNGGPGAGADRTAVCGFDALAVTLPPGSMTGAPKKRSCELLHAIEGTERSVYAGVVGYLDIYGRADWSVTIRTMFQWDDEAASGGEVWRIGAGGAVTTLSTPEAEREEMFAKLCGPLDVLRDVL